MIYLLTKNDIKEFLKEAGIKHDDKVTIHCSLRSIGEIENGADGLIDAFKEYLDEGLFIVPTHTWDKVWKTSPYYDVRSTVPDIGTLPEVAAFRKDGVRSLHPTHSVTVFGKGAKECGKEPTTIFVFLQSRFQRNCMRIKTTDNCKYIG